MKRAFVDSFCCIPPHASHRSRSEIFVNEHNRIKPFSTRVRSFIVFPYIFSYCQIKKPLSLLKNSLSYLKDLCQLSCESHTGCPSRSEGSHIFKFIPSPSFWQWNLKAVSTAEHTKNIHSAGACTK